MSYHLQPANASDRIRPVLSTLIAVSLSGAGLTAAASEGLVFEQSSINLYGPAASLVLSQPQSDWGSVDLTYLGVSSLQYFNLTVDGIWRVQNMPLLSNQGVGVDNTLTFNFSLGNTPGSMVSNIAYGYTISAAPLLLAPTVNSVAPVAQRQIHAGTAEGGVPLTLGAAPGALNGGGGFNSASHANFPNQDCDVNFCAPVSVSNSLQFLNAKFKLNMPAADITTAAIAAAIGTTANGTPLGWWEAKDAYMKRKGLPIKTTVSNAAQDAIDAIKKGHDVELGGGGHRAALVGIALLDDGTYAIDVAHDTDQTGNGGTKIERGKYDPVTGKITGITFWDGAAFRNFVIESPITPVPEPATWATLTAGLALLTLALRRRRG